MIASNSEIMRSAKASLRGRWGIAIGGMAVYFLVYGVTMVIPLVNYVAGILLAGPLTLGLTIFYLSISRNKEDVKVEQVFFGFKNFLKAFVAYLLMGIFAFLWSLLLLIPGIVAAISYSLTLFILADKPDIDANGAITLSKEMMKGHKWQYFRLMLRFFGLAVLCVFTFGIGFIWFVPFVFVTCAKFYDEVKRDYEERIKLSS